jgi:hypothetical protein
MEMVNIITTCRQFYFVSASKESTAGTKYILAKHQQRSLP